MQGSNRILLRKECIMMNGKRFSEDKARRNGFYLALAVCLVAVGIAAWSTYDAVHGYLTPTAEESSDLMRQQEQEVREGQSTPETSMPETDPEDPEGPKTASSSPARQAAGAVTQKPTVPPEESVKEESSKAPSAAPAPSSAPESQVQEPATQPMYEISSEMIYPIESGEIAKAYSAGAPVYSETMKDWRIHTGMDVKAESEAQVLACANGLVKETYTDSMLGNVVLIEHGEYEFYYCGLGENFLVRSGDVVSEGQAIGSVTAVPSEAAEQPHLHLEVRREGTWLDPQSVIEGKA